MNEFTEIFWSLTAKENQDIKFLKKISKTKELKIEKNKEIIDKLEEQQIYKITFLGNEALNYNKFIELLKYANSKGIKCELLFYDLFDVKSEKFKEVLRYIDAITLSIDSMIDQVNTKLGKEKGYYKKIKNILNELMLIDIKININTMAFSLNFEEAEQLKRYFELRNINMWRLINFNSMLISENVNEDKVKLSKINYQYFTQQAGMLGRGIKFVKHISDRVIENQCITIIPDGNAVVIFKNELYEIGSIVKDSIEKMQEKFKNTKEEIIEGMKEEKITVFVGTDNEEMQEEITKRVKSIRYAKLVGSAKSGIETYKKILKLKPEMVFLQYDFEDMSGYDIIMEVNNRLKLDTPTFNVLTDRREVTHSEFTKIMEKTHKLNCYIRDDYDKKRIRDIIKSYKEYIEL